MLGCSIGTVGSLLSHISAFTSVSCHSGSRLFGCDMFSFIFFFSVSQVLGLSLFRMDTCLLAWQACALATPALDKGPSALTSLLNKNIVLASSSLH